MDEENKTLLLIGRNATQGKVDFCLQFIFTKFVVVTAVGITICRLGYDIMLCGKYFF